MKKYLVAFFEVDKENFERIKDELKERYNSDFGCVLDKTKKQDVENEVKQILKCFKITPKYNGYDYLIESVKLIVEQNIRRILTVYQIVADNYDITIQKVERDIRTVIGTIVKKNKKEEIENIFGQRFDKITNSDFLFSVADLIKNS